jgi:ribosomal protein S18 acetylase RimI-like enzyme
MPADLSRPLPDAAVSTKPATPPGIRIRLMSPPDLAAYKALRDLLLATHPEAFTSDAETELRRPPESYLSRVAGAADGGWPFTLTAWQGELLCGAITCERDGRAKVRHVAHVVGMMVHPEARRRGIGGALLWTCVDICIRRAGIEMIRLSVTSANAAAIRLYERAGFVRYGRLERALLIGGHYHPKDMLVLNLDSKA